MYYGVQTYRDYRKQDVARLLCRVSHVAALSEKAARGGETACMTDSGDTETKAEDVDERIHEYLSTTYLGTQIGR